MKMPRTLAPLAAAALLLAVSAPTLASSEAEAEEPIAVDIIEGITWQLQRQAVDGELAALPDGAVVTLLMEGGQVGGNGGCNQYFGEYTRDGDALSFGDIGSTEMYCEGASDVEALYFANLAAVAGGFSTGGSLLMTDAAGDTILEFTPAAEGPLPVDGIEGIAWLLSDYLVGGDAVASVPAGVIATLMLEDGMASGSGGCNTFSAEYTLDGSSLTFGPIASTLMLCEGPGGEVETVYFAALAEVTGWYSDGGRLTLTDAEGLPLLGFLPAPETSVVGSWVATGINNGAEAVVTSDITTEVTAEFGPDGQLTGSDGCNRYNTSYEVDGERIIIAPEIMTTRMACASDELTEQSVWYMAALGNAATWSVGPAGDLELRDAGGALQVSYTPAA